MKISIPIEVKFDDMKSLINDLGNLQTYKLFEGDEITLVDIEDIAKVLTNHVKAREAERTGHWIDCVGEDMCSECGASYSDLYPDYDHTHYCPNCGCKMEVEHEYAKSKRFN